jgi:hypothetical protein
VIVTACPAAVVEASPPVVWDLLSGPSGLERWADVRLTGADPEGQMRPGQRLRFETHFLALRLAVTMDVCEVDVAARRLRILVRLPFGVVNDETITMAEVAPGRTLVRFG